MRLVDIAFGNIRRRKSKASLVVMGLALGVATAVALIAANQAMHYEIGTKLDEYGANIVVVPKTQQFSLSYGGITVPGVTVGTPEFSEDILAKINSIEQKDSLNVIAPKLVGVAKVQDQPVLLVGVRFDAELKMKKWWSLQGKRPSSPMEIILGSEVAWRLGKHPGEQLDLEGTRMDVAAVLAPTGGQEDYLIFADLARVQSMLGKPGRLTFVEVSAYCNTCPIEEIVSQISASAPEAKVTALKQSVQARADMVRRFNAFAVAVSAIVLLAGGMAVFTTMLSSVNERTREIGIFRAIGYRRFHIFYIMLSEAAFLSFISGVLGYLSGLVLARIVTARVVESSIQAPWDPALIGIALGLATAVGMIAGAYPAWRASRIDPAEALRFI
ncbi:MAG TPA: ABC transporter permease [Firmicutes bacterium]|nr:ABC transporter permease [Candidatus Fermentithermobacillaceae bacterium]